MVLLIAMECEQTPADCRGLEWFTTLELRPPGPGAEVLGFFFFFSTKNQTATLLPELSALHRHQVLAPVVGV